MGIGVMTWGDARGIHRLHPSKIAYGGADGPSEESRAFEVSIAAGGTLFDTAAMYGSGASERRLGDLAHGRDVIIATKFPSKIRGRIEELDADLDSSLERLRREHIDLYQHHFPSKKVSIEKLMDRLADAFDEGKIKAIGVSNYSESQMRIAHKTLADRGIPLASNQVQYSLLHRRPESNGVLDACQELGVTLIAYQPLASGALTGKYKGGVKPKGLRRFMSVFRGKGPESVAPVVATLREIGKVHNKTPAQVAIRWLIENENVLPIPGVKNEKQAKANAGALTFALSSDEVGALNRISASWVR